MRIAPRRRPLVGLTLRLFGWGPTKRLSQGRGVVVSEWRAIASRRRLRRTPSQVTQEAGYSTIMTAVALNWGGDA